MPRNSPVSSNGATKGPAACLSLVEAMRLGISDNVLRISGTLPRGKWSSGGKSNAGRAKLSFSRFLSLPRKRVRPVSRQLFMIPWRPTPSNDLGDLVSFPLSPLFFCFSSCSLLASPKCELEYHLSCLSLFKSTGHRRSETRRQQVK